MLFHPGRVLLQDFTGIPALVDLAAVRDAVAAKGGDTDVVDSLCPADIVVDHSVQLDYGRVAAAAKKAKAVADKELPKEEVQKGDGPQQQQQQQQHQPHPAPPPPPPPTLIVHSTFPPLPSAASYDPLSGFYYGSPPPQPTYVLSSAPVYSLPPSTYYSQFPPHFYPMTNTTSSGSSQPPLPLSLATSSPDQGQSSSKKADEIPTDNPGLPIQEEVCPFHHRISYWSDELRRSEETEFRRNEERFAFLKWVDMAFKNITVIPPGTGVMHQVNLEYLARVVTSQEGLLFPDSLVGTDAHTTIVNGLGVLGWGVGTLDAESVMFGHPISVQMPKVVGCRISGSSPTYSTSTELVLLVTKKLRASSVSGCFVEFFGPGVEELSVADRATIANMCPEYGALVGFFPTDKETLSYLSHTGRDRQQLLCIREYLKVVKMLREEDSPDPEYSQVIEIDLGEVQPCLSGPRSARDKVPVAEVGQNFKAALTADSVSKRGFGLATEHLHRTISVDVDKSLHAVAHGSVVLAAISSCSNTSNPSVMLGAGLLAKKAIESGLSVAKYIKTSLSPGSGVVTSYLHESGVMPYLYMLGFEVSGYGCPACVGNNDRPLAASVCDAIGRGNLVCCGVLSGNRNFEGRLQPQVRANYLASPLLVIAYAIAGRIDIDFEKEPLGRAVGADDKPIFLRDIWPTRDEVREVERRFVIPAIFRQAFARIAYGNKHWSSLASPHADVFPWDQKSTFIQSPEYINEVSDGLWEDPRDTLKGMRCLLKLGDNVSSDHISPAGSIVRNSPAADYLSSLGLVPRDYNSYGARRGNCQVMMRGAFAHVRLRNELSDKVGPHTVHFPSEVPTTVFEASRRYKEQKVPLFVVAGENFGRGAARDWATKGPLLVGVRAVLAVSFDPAFRANLVRTGILPVQIDRATHEILTGREELDILLPDLAPKQEGRMRKRCRLLRDPTIVLSLNGGGFELEARARLDNSYEVGLFAQGGVIRSLMRKALAPEGREEEKQQQLSENSSRSVPNKC